MYQRLVLGRLLYLRLHEENRQRSVSVVALGCIVLIQGNTNTTSHRFTTRPSLHLFIIFLFLALLAYLYLKGFSALSPLRQLLVHLHLLLISFYGYVVWMLHRDLLQVYIPSDGGVISV